MWCEPMIGVKSPSVTMLPGFLERAHLLPKDIKAKLVKALWLLSENFRHPSLQCKPVQGACSHVYECRVDQKIRLIYDMSGQSLRCWYVGEHDEALRFATNFRSEAVLVDDIQVDRVNETLLPLHEFLADGTLPQRWNRQRLHKLASVLLSPNPR